MLYYASTFGLTICRIEADDNRRNAAPRSVDGSTMSNEEIREIIFSLIGSFNEKNIPLNPETTFSIDLDLDSLTVMDLVATIEDEFDIVLPLNLLPDLENIQQVANAVEKIVKGQ